MNNVMASFDTTMRQMTENYQWPIFSAKNDWNVSAKKTPPTYFCVAWERKCWGQQQKGKIYLYMIYFQITCQSILFQKSFMLIVKYIY